MLQSNSKKLINLNYFTLITTLVSFLLFAGCGGSNKNQESFGSASDNEAALLAYQNSDWSTAPLGELNAEISLDLAKSFFEDESSFVFGKKLKF